MTQTLAHLNNAVKTIISNKQSPIVQCPHFKYPRHNKCRITL